MSTNFRDDAGVVRLDGTLFAPGASVGDVLTVQADGSLAPATGGGSQPGAAIVKGPYPVDFSDFAGAAYLDPLTLFVPVIGTHIIGIWFDPNTAVEFDADSSGLGIGQNLDFDMAPNGWLGQGSGIAPGQNIRFPTNGTAAGVWQKPVYADLFSGSPPNQAQIVIATADPVTAAWDPAGPPSTPPSQGYWDVYFMLATPVAP